MPPRPPRLSDDDEDDSPPRPPRMSDEDAAGDAAVEYD